MQCGVPIDLLRELRRELSFPQAHNVRCHQESRVGNVPVRMVDG